MGGPSAVVLLRRALSEAEAGEFDEWMWRAFIQEEHDPEQWRLADPGSLGAPPEAASSCPIDVSRRSWRAEDTSDERRAELIGYQPAEEIVVSAACSQTGDHLALGYLCLGLARRWNSFVDFTGLLQIVPVESAGLTLTRDEADAAMAAQAKAARRFPGVLHATRYRIQAGRYGRYGITNTGDADFLAAWLRHPRFYMVK